MLFCGCSVTLSAQATLRGTISDKDGDGVEFASVSTIGYTPVHGSLADRRGRYMLTLPSDTSITLRCSFVGKEPVEFTVRLRKGETRVKNIVLKDHASQLGPVTIRDNRVRISNFDYIERQRLEQVVGPNSGIENLLKTLPDVNSNNELSSQYSVRGGSFDENLVYINDVEIYRPQLIRSGQQEGMSIINPDLIHHIQFSPGGFEAAYGDKLSSVLDLIYARPTQFQAKASASFLGLTASVQGLAGHNDRFSYSVGIRQHSNRYVFSSLETKGAYTSSYSDLQAVLGYMIDTTQSLSLLTILSRNVYGLIPESQTTMLGGFFNPMRYDAYFDGQEQDRYFTSLAAATYDWHPSDLFNLRWITSVQHLREREIYDVQTQYWIYQVNMGTTDSLNSEFERGVGTSLEHARNHLSTTVLSSEVKAYRYARLGSWLWGLRWQYDRINDYMREWKWIDSAGYALPYPNIYPGDSSNAPHSPILQLFCNANNVLSTQRAMGYAQRSLNFTTNDRDDIGLLLGIRAHVYQTMVDSATFAHVSAPGAMPIAAGVKMPPHLVVSPRLSLSYRPNKKLDIVYRLAAGTYSQPPLYREYRLDDGSLNLGVKAQQSYQLMATTDVTFRWLDRPFRLTGDIYYKYITDLIPYRIDNLRVRYDANNDAVGYATGLSLRLAGDFVPGLESWASLSVMKTQEDLLGDTLGWLARPTDQRFSTKVFFQDYVPSIPFWRMSLNFIYASGLPAMHPRQRDREVDYRLPAYFRVDWGNTLELSRIERFKNWRLFQYVDDVLLGVEVFNLFNYQNVVSYIWVRDYNDQYNHVANYLTARQINVKLTLCF